MGRQLILNIYKGRHGGRRPGSGRKRLRSKGVSHRKREKVLGRTPLHINFKYRIRIKNKEFLKILKRAILNARNAGLHVIHFSLQHNHIHLITEAASNKVLTKGMRSLTVTLAKALNSGKVQSERYHLHVLKTLRETKNAIHYVLFNEQKHGGGRIDSFSSLLSIPHSFKLLREFSRIKKMTLFIGKADDYKELSPARSFLLKHALDWPAPPL